MNRTSDLFAWGWAGVGERSRYSELTILSAEASFVACHKPFLFDKMKDCLKDIISQKDIEDNEGDVRSAFVDDDGFQPNRDHVYVGDPIKVSNKGPPKQNRRETKNGRPKAYDEVTIRLFSICRSADHH